MELSRSGLSSTALHYYAVLYYIHTQQEGPTGEALLESAEEFGRIVSSTIIKNTSNVSFTQNPNIEKENVG